MSYSYCLREGGRCRILVSAAQLDQWFLNQFEAEIGNERNHGNPDREPRKTAKDRQNRLLPDVDAVGKHAHSAERFPAKYREESQTIGRVRKPKSQRAPSQQSVRVVLGLEVFHVTWP